MKLTTELAFTRHLNSDGKLLFATRIARLFAYGFLSIILVLYLAQVGLSGAEIGALLTLTLLGDAAISLWITTSADRVGRRKMLLLGAGLMLFAGIVFALTGNIVLLAVAAIIGVISPGGGEIGPFLSIEQAALAHIVPNDQRTRVFAWYNLVGSFATATGALVSGALAQFLQANGFTALDSYRVIVIGYAAFGILLALMFARLSPRVEVGTLPRASPARIGLHRSRGIVLKLSALFALDAFAGGFIVQSLIAYWFQIRWGVEPALLGAIFFGGNILAGISALSAARIAARVGLINTMVWTHIPSNILLMFVPLMPTLPLAIFLLLVRMSISQMDVPTRQSYTMAVVAPDERSAASGITTIARSLGAAWSPALTGALLSASLLTAPFFLAGGLKIIYDLTLWRSFRAMKPPEERMKAEG
ncbi:MAG: MFS transporter [Anaerolineales bacterium]|nr:MFS transporter [Anaerolineales bacterium]